MTDLLPRNPPPATPCLAMRPKQAAAALGISERLLWTLTHNGDVPYIKCGSATLYPTAQLVEWLAAKAKSSAGAPDSAPSVEEDSEKAGGNADSSGRIGTNQGGTR